MNIFDDYTLQVLQKFNLYKVNYLIVGGYAVNHYGYRRTTGDIDLWLKPDNDNKLLVISALKELDIDEYSIEYLENLDFTTPVVFSDGEDPFKIDFMTFIAGKLNFEEAFEKRTLAEYENIEMPFINLSDLILSKITTNRTKDKLDVETLQNFKDKKE